MLEIMLAMSILSMGMLVLLAGFSEGMRARKSAALYSRAIILTGNLMDEQLFIPCPEEGVTEGAWDDEPSFHWTVEVRPFEIEGAEPKETALSEITTTTRWQEGSRGKTYQLKTVMPSCQ